jgi:hypothetical protein
MDRAHDIKNVIVSGAVMKLRVDGKDHAIDPASQSSRLATATQANRENFEVSSSGYGICWPDLDEDLSIDGLIDRCEASISRR